jgi:glutamate--cysteine ligase
MTILRDEVPRTALKTPFRGGTVREIAIDTLRTARLGLKNRARLDSTGMDETHFLKPMNRIAESGFTPAEELLSAFEHRWEKNVDPVFQEYAY